MRRRNLGCTLLVIGESLGRSYEMISDAKPILLTHFINNCYEFWWFFTGCDVDLVVHVFCIVILYS